MAKLISKTYGEAIFELAVSENKVDTFLEEIRMILSVLKENPKFSDSATTVYYHPHMIDGVIDVKRYKEELRC